MLVMQMGRCEKYTMEPIRILHVFASLDRGGAETMLMNIYRNIDRTKVQFDFVVNDNNEEYAYEKEIMDLGGRIYRIPRYTLDNHLKYKKAWYKLLMNNTEWKIVHAHHTSTASIYLRIAKYFNLITIAHSHTAGGEFSFKSRIKMIMRYPIRYIADYLFACSVTAAKWMFGKDDTEVKIINNAIDSSLYVYSFVNRQMKRREFHIEDKFVVGHIGNFTNVKNYPFIIEVFDSILKKNSNSVLMLVGNMNNNPQIMKRVKELNFESKVIFTGVRSDVPELLSAMDVFLFPSLYEGLPLTLIEAQASGLKCIVSDTITDEVQITDLVEFISLDKSPDNWADSILNYKESYERRDTSEKIRQAGYDIKEKAKEMEDFYLNQYIKLSKEIE